MAQIWNDTSLPWQNPSLPWKSSAMPWNNVLLPWKAGTASMSISGSTISAGASIADVVGTVSITGSFTGTASWSLADNVGGKYAIDSSTGIVTVAASLSAGTDTIIVSVSGISPTITNTSFPITVTGVVATGNPMGLLLTLTYS